MGYNHHADSTAKMPFVLGTSEAQSHTKRVYVPPWSWVGYAQVKRSGLSFLLHNDLLTYNLIFFVDGQCSLSKTIGALFAWFTPRQLILDWPASGQEMP